MKKNLIVLDALMSLKAQREHLQKHILELEEDKVRNKERLRPLYILLNNLEIEIEKLESREDC